MTKKDYVVLAETLKEANLAVFEFFDGKITPEMLGDIVGTYLKFIQQALRRGYQNFDQHRFSEYVLSSWQEFQAYEKTGLIKKHK